MRLDEGMGYDGQQRSGRPRLLLAWPMVVVAIVAVGVIVLIASTIASARTVAPGDPGPAPADSTVTAPAGSDPPASLPVSPGPTPAADGHDAEEQAGAGVEVWGTFEAFMAAWCSTDPAVREQGFARTATSDLAQGLAETSPENVVTAARTKVEVVGAGPYSAEFRVWFENVPTSVHAILIADPGSPHGWRVSRVEKRGD